MKTYDYIMVGNGVAAMVAASELARNGRQVLAWNPAPQWGAHFGGLDLAGERFDIGMNFLEFTSFAAQCDRPESYSASIRNDSGRFTAVIRRYIEGLVTVVPTATPTSLYRGIFAPDLVISNQFALLDLLPEETKTCIRSELNSCIAAFAADSTWHARNKIKDAERFAEASLERVSLANHGPTLHELLVESCCQRIIGQPSSAVSALLHRVVWLPIYHPETLLNYLSGSGAALKQTTFHYPQAGAFAAVIEALEKRMASMGGLEVWRDKTLPLTRAGAGWRLGDKAEGKKLVWALRPGQLASQFGGTDGHFGLTKSSVGIAFVSIPRECWRRRFSTLLVMEKDSPIYRVTDQSWSAGRVSEAALCTVELSAEMIADWPLHDAAHVAARLLGHLRRLDILDSSDRVSVRAIRMFKDVIVQPSAANRRKALDEHARVAAGFSDVELIGASAPFGANSFNDSIVQGLRLGRLAATH